MDDPTDRPRPFNFNERTKQVLPICHNMLQEDLNSLKAFATSKFLKIKEKKTILMKCNFSRTNDFPPELVIDGFNERLEVVSETKLFGIILTNDLKWGGNTDYICKKA